MGIFDPEVALEFERNIVYGAAFVLVDGRCLSRLLRDGELQGSNKRRELIRK